MHEVTANSLIKKFFEGHFLELPPKHSFSSEEFGLRVFEIFSSNYNQLDASEYAIKNAQRLLEYHNLQKSILSKLLSIKAWEITKDFLARTYANFVITKNLAL